MSAFTKFKLRKSQHTNLWSDFKDFFQLCQKACCQLAWKPPDEVFCRTNLRQWRWRPGHHLAGQSVEEHGRSQSRPTADSARSWARPVSAARRSSPAPNAPSHARSPSPSFSESIRGNREINKWAFSTCTKSWQGALKVYSQQKDGKKNTRPAFTCTYTCLAFSLIPHLWLRKSS